MPFRTLLLASAFALAACQTAPAPPPPVLPFEGATLRSAERSEAPGVVGAILRDGQVVEMFAWGGADCAGGGTANPFASYEIGSISKHITAVALLQLWDRDQVDLDAPVGRYLDDIPEAWRAVTLRQLLTHTSGVPDYEEAGGYGIYETQPTPAQVYDIVDDRPLDFEPGTRWSYSNTGYFLLSLVVQRVSGERFGDYLRNHLFAPLDMDHSFMGGYAPADATLAQGCRPGEGEGAARIPVVPIHEASTFGAGGISSTLQDWAKWDQALHSGRLLSPRAMEALFTPQVLPDGDDTTYSFGIFHDEFRGERRRTHNGQTQGFVADYAHFPDHDVSTIVFANMYGGGISVSRGLALRVMPELSYDRIPVPTDPDPARTERSRRALRQMILGETPADLLSPQATAVATEARFADVRAQLRPYAERANDLVYLRSDPPDGDVERHLYRIMLDGETQYVSFIWSEGVVIGLRREDE
jgi:D-alanyl-D-alanine carboxypeptidase